MEHEVTFGRSELLSNNALLGLRMGDAFHAFAGVRIASRNNFYVSYYFPDRDFPQRISVHGNFAPGQIHKKTRDGRVVWEQPIEDFREPDSYSAITLRARSVDVFEQEGYKPLPASFIEKYDKYVNFWVAEKEMWDRGGFGFDGVFVPNNEQNASASNEELMKRLAPPRGVSCHLRAVHKDFGVITVIRAQNIEMEPGSAIECSAVVKVNATLRSGETLSLKFPPIFPPEKK